MNRTHFRNQLTGSLFTKLECQIACALVEHVRTRRHRRGYRNVADHTQPPTLRMLNDIMQFVRSSIWYEAHETGLSCNSMPPDAYLNAYCLVRNLRTSPSHGGWYSEVENNPQYWKYKAYDVFDRWISSRTRLVRECVFPFLRRLVNKSTAANHRSVYNGMVQWHGTSEGCICNSKTSTVPLNVLSRLQLERPFLFLILDRALQTFDQQFNLNLHMPKNVLGLPFNDT